MTTIHSHPPGPGTALVMTAHQPAYLPWLGYFDKLIRSDLMVFLDSVQFEKNSYINRNRIKTANGPLWLTIPILTRGHAESTLRDTRIDRRQPWMKKHLRSIAQSYRAAPRFPGLFHRLEQLYRDTAEIELLSDLCFAHLKFWLAELGIEKRIVRASELHLASKKSDLVLELCRQFGATRYISGSLGRSYLDIEAFASEGIAVEFQDYVHPVYCQLHGPFVPAMGIVDYLMNADTVTAIGGTTQGGMP